jgi:peptide/nickel transport system permease protein
VLTVACLAFLAIVLVCAVAGSLIAPRDPSAQDLLAGIQGPSAEHLLGTDDSGRDILSRLIVGARAAILGPLLIAVGQAAVGTVLGLLAGYRGGWLDALIMRAADVIYAMPGLLVAIVLLGVVGGGYTAAVAVLIVLGSPSDTRIVRGGTLEQRPLPYVDAARTLGLSSRRIMFRHIWPNLVPLIVATTFLNFAYALVALSALSFLGLGVGIGAADWGRMLYENLPLIADNPFAALAPGALIVMTAMAMNLTGDSLYERLVDRRRAR